MNKAWISLIKLSGHNSIRRKLFFASAILVAIPLCSIILLLGLTLTKKFESDYIGRISAEILHVDRMLGVFFDGVYGNLKFLGNHPLISKSVSDKTINNYIHSRKVLMNSNISRSRNEWEIFKLMGQVTRSMPDYSGVVYAAKNGRYITDNTMVKFPKGFDPRTRPNYTAAMKRNGEPTVAKPFLTATGDYVVFGSQAFKGSYKTLSYIVSIGIELKQLTEKINRIRIGESGFIILTDQDGIVLVHPVKEFLGKNISELGSPAFMEAVIKGDSVVTYNTGGIERTARVLTAEKTGWKIVGVLDRSEITAGARQAILRIIATGIVFIVFASVIAWYIARRISDPVTDVAGVLNKTASGDFTVSIDVKYEHSDDEIGVLSRSFNDFIKIMRDTIGEIIFSSQNLARTVEEIAKGNENLSQRTSEQASSLEEIASTVEEASAVTKQNAGNSLEASRLAENSSKIAQEGGRIVDETVISMGEINASSRKISDILNLINEIAFQTNLLALNAAVEAARAGEQGRGFAVVAGEVRNLAQRSSGAAKDIQKLIEETLQKIEEGTGLVNKSGEALKEIINSVMQVNSIIAEISSSSDEQARGIEQITIAITDMDTMTQQNAALVEETASASEGMAGQAQELLVKVRQFKIPERI